MALLASLEMLLQPERRTLRGCLYGLGAIPGLELLLVADPGGAVHRPGQVGEEHGPCGAVPFHRPHLLQAHETLRPYALAVRAAEPPLVLPCSIQVSPCRLRRANAMQALCTSR